MTKLVILTGERLVMGKEHSSLEAQISEKFMELSPQLQRAARFVLDHPDDVALKSMRRVAEEAGVHPTTMTRLARAFGCDGYNDFRRPFQNRIRLLPTDFIGRVQRLQERVGKERVAILEEVVDTTINNLRGSFEPETIERLVSCAKVLSKGNRVFAAGARGCYPVVFYFNYIYSFFRSNSVLMDGSGGTFADHLRSFGEGDVIFSVSFAPYSLASVKAIKYAQEIGGEAVVLTDSLASPVAGKTDQTLIMKTESPSFFQSVLPAMAAVEALVTLMVLDDGNLALESIERSERQLDRFDAYWAQTEANTKGNIYS